MSLFERITTLSLSLIPDVVFCHPFFVGAMPAVGLWILLVRLFEGTLCSSKKSISWKSKSTPVNKLFFFPEVVLPFCGTHNFDESMWDFRSPTRQAWKLWIWRRDTICFFFSKKTWGCAPKPLESSDCSTTTYYTKFSFSCVDAWETQWLLNPLKSDTWLQGSLEYSRIRLCSQCLSGFVTVASTCVTVFTRLLLPRLRSQFPPISPTWKGMQKSFRCFKNICTRISSVDHLYMYRINLSLMFVKLDFQWFSPRRPCIDFWNPPFGLSSQPLVGGMEVGDSATVREAQWDFDGGGGWMGIIGIYWYTVI